MWHGRWILAHQTVNSHRHFIWVVFILPAQSLSTFFSSENSHSACPRLIKKAFLAEGCTQGGSIYQMTKSKVITVCFSTQLHYMWLCWIAVWCCLLGFPLNLGRTINSPFDSIITIQRIFFYFIGTLWVFCIFSKLDAVFFSFVPVNDSDPLKICLRGCQADGLLLLILVQRNIAWETKEVK